MMTKIKFLLDLTEKLSGLPQQDIEERLMFYSEMIEDRVEEGLSEEDAVASIGTVEDISAQIKADALRENTTPPKKDARRKMKPWEIVLLVVGSPIWLALLISVLAVAVSLYVVLWALVISLWSVSASFAACSVGGVFAGVLFICKGNVVSGIAMIGMALACAGFSVLCFYACKAATGGFIKLTCKIWSMVKRRILKKEVA